MEKEQTREISTGRKLLFLLIILFVFLLLIEGMLSIYFYRQIGGEKFATIESFKAVRKQIRGDDNPFAFEPWIEYRNKRVDGQKMAAGELVRRSEPDTYLPAAPGDTLDIYFFGGATMQGLNVADEATIPSQFVKLYGEQLATAQPVRVHNYGSSYYYSYQEMVLLADLLQRGHRPHILVFLDGINDFRYGVTSYYRQSYFSYIFRQFFESGLRSKGKLAFLDTAGVMCKTPSYMPAAAFNQGLMKNYSDNIRNITMLADIIGAKAYFFCEPAPYYGTEGSKGEGECAEDVVSRFQQIYPSLQQSADSMPGFTFLGNMPTQANDFVVGNQIAYSPSLNRKVAEQIFQVLKKDLDERLATQVSGDHE